MHTRIARLVFSFWFVSPPYRYLQLRQERIQVVRSTRLACKRPARGHSRNGPWTCSHTHTHIGKRKRNRTKHAFINAPHVWRAHTRIRNSFFIYLIDSKISSNVHFSFYVFGLHFLFLIFDFCMFIHCLVHLFMFKYCFFLFLLYFDSLPPFFYLVEFLFIFIT